MWFGKCCRLMLEEPEPVQVFEVGLPTPGLHARAVISRFVDHVPYYRQEIINARSGVYTPRWTVSGWASQTGAQIAP